MKFREYKDCVIIKREDMGIESYFVRNDKLKIERRACLTDLVDYNDYDMVMYDGDIYVLYKDRMYKINSIFSIDGDVSLYDKIERVDSSLYIDKYKREYDYYKYSFSNYESIDKLLLDILMDFALEIEMEILSKIKLTKTFSKGAIEIKDINEHYEMGIVLRDDREYEDGYRWDREEGDIVLYVPEGAVSAIEEQSRFYQGIVSNVLRDDLVRDNLETSLWIYREFSKQKGFIKGKGSMGIDYSFLIVNNIKAMEAFLYKKIVEVMPVYKGKKLMLGKMIKIIEDNTSRFIKEKYLSYSDKLIEIFSEWKDKYRNSYFHKDCLMSFDEVNEIRHLSYKLVLIVEMFFKK